MNRIINGELGYSDEEIEVKRLIHAGRKKAYPDWHNKKCDTCRWLATVDRIKKEKKIMEEVLTCKCGNQKWTIFSDRLECINCKYLLEFGYNFTLKISKLNEIAQKRTKK